MVKVALLGTWHVHTEWFIKEMLNSGLAELTMVWDDNKERGKNFSDRLGVPFENSLEKVLSREDVEAVIVECATTRHKEMIVKAANAGKHIFSDKALTLNSVDCMEIKRAIEDNRVKFLLSLESKIIGSYQYAKKLVEKGKLGRVTSAYFRRAHQAALDKDMLPSYWFNTEETGGGVTLDLGCHGLYLLPQFCGKPKQVTCLMNELYNTGSDENSTTVIEFENGAIGTSHTSFVAYRMDNLLEIIGTEGSIIISGTDEDNFRVFLQSKNVPGHENLMSVPKEELPKDDEYPIVQFVRMIEAGENAVRGFDMDTAIMLTRLIECAYESAKEKKTVQYS
jgi:predicted dehydrogenase